MRLELDNMRDSLFLLHFNSIKVRLELSATANIDTSLSFQFHKGAIRTYYKDEGAFSDFNFNSIKVRLERYLSIALLHA